ncbi:MAG: hypothetical protein GX605_02255 [Chloroflexi bacterium]|nr:hypothetical protein [Chloroflexota bacterium]
MTEQQIPPIVEAILARRTTRQFTQQAVDDDLIRQVLQMAMYAPSRLGQRPWQFVVVRNAETRQKLRAALRVGEGYGDAPVLVAVLVPGSTTQRWDLDAAAATQNLLLAATALGLGSAWVANPTSAEWSDTAKRLPDLIGSPSDAQLVALVALGHMAAQLPPYRVQDVLDPKAVHLERVDLLPDTEHGRRGGWRDFFGHADAWTTAEQAAPRVPGAT